MYDLMGNDELAVSFYRSAVVILERRLNENIGDAMLHAAISRVYVQLGLFEEAVKSAQLAVALVPPSRDAWYGMVNKTNLAFIYVSAELMDDEEYLLRSFTLDDGACFQFASERLRNKKEFVNHKILDCMGDLYLSGYKIIGKLICSQGGHKLTNQLLRRVFKDNTNFSIIEVKEKNIPHSFINRNILKSIA